LLDDNFRTIVQAIAEGRQLFRNLQLSFQYILMIHIPLVITAALSVLRLRFVSWPLHPVGLLLAHSYPIKMVWFSVFVGWLLKVLAVRRNRAMAGALGIDTARVDMMIFVFGSGLAGIAGATLAPIKSVSTTMGFPYAVDSYMVLVLGGVGSLWGVVAGSGLIGEAETILAYIYNSVIGKLLVFVFIVIIIRVVPRGIFGYYERR